MKRSNAYEGRLTTMATILLAWELGGGLGHFMNLRPVAEGLARRGHRVVAVLRDLTSARRSYLIQGFRFSKRPSSINTSATLNQPARSPKFCTFADSATAKNWRRWLRLGAICSSTSNLT